jgi:ferrochelatase
MNRIAIVLFNLGGPDQPSAVRPFLFNLFNDAAIIRAPGPVRWILAQLISRRRAPKARAIYAKLGGGSPLLPNTEAQARAVAERLGHLGDVRSFVCMRYWHPMSDAVAHAVKDYAPDRIVLLPLYPQYSTTTTESSLGDWQRAAAAAGLDVPTRAIGCYPTDPGLVAGMAARIRPALAEAALAGKPRLLFSAHGLPKRIVEAGDPYQWQVGQTAAAVVHALAIPDLDWIVCYQSRVGPLEWIGPSTEAEIDRAGADRVPVAIVPVAFVSDHSETLVEIEVEYRHRAGEAGVPKFVRVPALGIEDQFIAGLARLVEAALSDERPVRSGAGPRLCPASVRHCACG